MSVNRVFGLVVLLLMIAATVSSAQPIAVSATYHENTNEIAIEFDAQIFTNAEYVAMRGIAIDDDRGGKDADVVLRGGTLVNTNDVGTSIRLKPYFTGVIDTYLYNDAEGAEVTADCWGLDYQDLMDLETMTDQSAELRVWLPAGAVRGTDGIPNVGNWAPLTYDATPDGQLTEVQDVYYNANTNILRLEFNNLIRNDQIAEDISKPHPVNPAWSGPGNGKLDILVSGDDLTEDRNENDTLDFEQNVRLTRIVLADASGKTFTPTSALDMTRRDSTSISLRLTKSGRASLEELDLNTLTISFSEFTFVDVDYNTVESVENMAVQVTRDTTPFLPDSARYNFGENRLSAWFNENLYTDDPIKDYIVIPKFWVHSYLMEVVRDDNDNPIDTVAVDSLVVYLSGGDPGTTGSNGVKISTKIPDSRVIEDYFIRYQNITDPDRYLVYWAYLNANAVLSEEGNGNREANCPLTFVLEDDRNKAPEPDPAEIVTYDAATNELYVRFDVRLDQDVDLTGFALETADSSHQLTGGTFERESGNKALRITLNGYDQKVFESLEGHDDPTLRIDPYSVFQQNIFNGNRQISAIPVVYTADPNPPLPKYVFYNFMDGTLVLESNPPLTVEQIDITKLTFAGVTLTEPDSVTTGSDGLVEYDVDRLIYHLSEGDVNSLNAIEESMMDSIIATFDVAFLTNGDGVQSELFQDVSDMQMLTSMSNSSEVLLGYGRDFFVKAFQVFPTIPRKLHASIRKISDHALWYVSNEQWTGITKLNGVFHDNEDSGKIIDMPLLRPVKPAEIDAMVSYFEDSTPKDTTRGVYEQLVDIFAGDYSNKVPEKVDILLADVFDDFGEAGRNDSKAGYWKHGYFDPANLPGQGDEYGNNAELLIIDSYPQSFIQGEVAYKWDDQDYEWDLADTTALNNGLPALANIFTQYVLYKVDKYEQNWVRVGLAYLSEFLVDQLPKFYGESVAKGIGGGNILTRIGADYNSRTDYVHLFMFFLYVWEKYGGDDVLTEIAESPRIGVNSIDRVIEARQDALEPYLRGKTLKQIYLDFATANLIDTTYAPAADNGIYMFENINTQGSVRGTQFKWKASSPKDRPPYQAASTDWGFDYYYTSYGIYDSNPVISDPIGEEVVVFAGESDSDLLLRKLNVRANNISPTLGSEYLVQDVTGTTLWNEDLNMGRIPMSMPDEGWSLNQDFRMFILIATGESQFNVTNETRTSNYTQMYVAQNPELSRKLDIYIISEFELYNDDGDKSPVLLGTRDSATGDTLTHYTELEYFEQLTANNEMSAYNFYQTEFWLADVGTYFWQLRGYYANGLPVQADTLVVGVSRLPANGPGELEYGEELTFHTTSRAFDQDVFATVSSVNNTEMIQALTHLPNKANDGLRPVSRIYNISAGNAVLNDPAFLTISCDLSSDVDGDPGVYILDENEWRYMGGSYDALSGTVTCPVSSFGKFQIFSGTHGEVDATLAVPTEYALAQNYPNPFNPSTTINFSLPNASNVSLVIYDVMGREVAKLIDREMPFGNHSLVWDGRSTAGLNPASGMYFIRLEADGVVMTRKMMLVK
ncbi:T9SS type A sorting domain-containing protein [bacterium]|nr:T9SS type A sorting domain-containing protein [bacterium]